MAPKYDKQIAISHEQEGSYQRREVTSAGPRQQPASSTTYHTERYVVPAKSSSRRLAAASSADDSDGNNYDEWTTSKRKVNHKTRQVETRVSRQLLVEDGKVIADSGPQVTTRIKEDNKTEECEREKAPKSRRAFDALEAAPEAAPNESGRVLGEKKEIQRVSREVREENMQYHDERFKELSGKDVHRRAIKAPHELMTVQQEHESSSRGAPRGKMVHYSNKGKKYQDTDEILEVAKLAIDGSVTKEVKHTRHHEEFSDDEKPDDKGEAEALRAKPVVERSSRRHVDYVNDFDDFGDSPDVADSSDGAGGRQRATRRRHQHSGPKEDPAFPRYQIDPLLDSLRDEDFRVSSSSSPRHADERQHGEAARVPVRRRTSVSSASSPERAHSASRSGAGRVQIPEEYRVNKQRLMSGGRAAASREQAHTVRQVPRAKQQQAAGACREDASVQARLTDEEHELSHRGRQQAARHYYYGDASRVATGGARRRVSSTSSSSSSSELELAPSSPDLANRKHGVQSRDSGFRSPAQRAQTPSSQIYSVSSKSSAKRRGGGQRELAASPTPSAGQRSVKTTTTTMSAGLKQRPLSPEHLEEDDDNVRVEPKRPMRRQNTQHKQKQHEHRHGQHNNNKANKHRETPRHDSDASETTNDEQLPASLLAYSDYKRRQRHDSLDRQSISSLNGPNATKIQVPYRKFIELERRKNNERDRDTDQSSNESAARQREMSRSDDIESLNRRLANIRRASETPDGQQIDHYDYKTLVANVQPAANKHQRQQQVYNVQVLTQHTPFAASKLDADKKELANLNENNNEANFNLDDYQFKYRAIPALVEPSVLLYHPDLSLSEAKRDIDDDRMSQISSCSLQSSRTYNVCKVSGEESPTSKTGADQQQQATAEVAANKQQLDDELRRKNPAWIFDPRDGSSTAIAPPPKPKKPPTPEVQTEELVQAPGGRSYYLELVEKAADVESEPSQASLYSRWNSQGALNARDRSVGGGFVNWQPSSNSITAADSKQPQPSQQISKPSNSSNLVKLRPTMMAQSTSKIQAPGKSSSSSTRKQLPYAGGPLSSASSSINLGNRSKSSSCLLSVTKPSKYSIYGGFRKPGENNKPVPRLSYSRAIGPRSHRQADTPNKVPSRYLKMK